MTHSHDPRPTERLVAAYALALQVARTCYPGLPGDEHHVVVQDAYLRVLQRLAQGPLEDPVAYLLRVVRNTGGRVLRRRGQHERTYVPSPDSGDEDLAVDPDRSLAPLTPEEQVLARAETALIWDVLTRELSPRDRLLLVRRRFEGCDPAEIAAELGTTRRYYRHLIVDAGRLLEAGVERARTRERLAAQRRRDGSASAGAAPASEDAPADDPGWSPTIVGCAGTDASCPPQALPAAA